jgi:hypothetical protein
MQDVQLAGLHGVDGSLQQGDGLEVTGDVDQNAWGREDCEISRMILSTHII